ncbi:MAG: hypothetical protein ACOCUH_02295 [Bacteriovoracia bacterium]
MGRKDIVRNFLKNKILTPVIIGALAFIFGTSETCAKTKKYEVTDLTKFYKDKGLDSTSISYKIFEGKNVVNSEVDSDDNWQKLDFYITAMHKKSCTKVMRRLSQYEDYSKFIGPIKKSSYNDDTKYVNFRIDAMVLPKPLTMNFKIPRIRKPGKYLFVFEKGFLKNLKGNVELYEMSGCLNNRRPCVENACLFWIKANWKGEPTGFNDTIIRLFTETVSSIALDSLFHVVPNT